MPAMCRVRSHRVQLQKKLLLLLLLLSKSVSVTALYIVSFELLLVCCLVKVSLSGSPSLESASAVHARNVQSTLAPRSIAKKIVVVVVVVVVVKVRLCNCAVHCQLRALTSLLSC